MLVSHLKKFIYTKTSKTGGTSVECYFERYCFPAGQWTFSHAREVHESAAGIAGYRGPDDGVPRKWYHHMAAKQIRDQIGRARFDEYFKFCVIRDPFDKAVSQFFFVHERPVLEEHLRRSGPGYLIDAFRKWVVTSLPPAERACYMIDGAVCMDFFIRHERLGSGVEEVCAELALPYEPTEIPRLKAGSRIREIPLPDFYDPGTVERVGDAYSLELELFGYKPPI